MAIQYTPSDLISKISNNDFAYTNSYKKRVREADTDVEGLQKEIEDFRKNVRSLRNYSSGVTTKSKLEKQLNKLVKSYNSMKKAAGNVTDDEVKEQMTKLENLFTDNEKNLKKIGIKEASDGKLSFDKEVFEDAEDKDIDKLFLGKDSFIDMANKIMRKVEKSADEAQYDMVERRISRTTRYDQQDIVVADKFILADSVVSTLEAYNNKVQSGTLDTKDKEENLYLDFSILAATYNIDPDDKSGQKANIQQLYIDNEDNLANIGLSFNADKTKMTFDNTIVMTTDSFKNAYQTLFGSDSVFAKGISEFSKNAFYSIINPEKLGVSIINEQV